LGVIVQLQTEGTMLLKLRLGRSTIAGLALLLAGCSAAAHRQAQAPGWATQKAWARFKTCVTSVMNEPKYAGLLVHSLDLDTMQPTTGQLADATIPSEQDARLFAARFDATNRCREELLMAVATPRPDLAPIIADEFTQAGAIAVLIVERRVTWADAARRSQALSGELQQEIAAADLQWIVDLNPFHQADMAQLQAAAAQSRQRQMIDTAPGAVVTNGAGPAHP
jgi:hypothetical protein